MPVTNQLRSADSDCSIAKPATIERPGEPPQPLRTLRVAIVHYWFLNGLGGERVTRILAQMFPRADIYTLLANPDAIPPELRSRRITTSFLQHVPGAARFHRYLMPLYPVALEQFDVSNYDLVISAESGPAKGVITVPATCHLCFCHSPMRYIWDMYHSYRNEPGLGFLQRLAFSLSAHYVRLWDIAASQRVDRYIAISRYVKKRIQKYYQREATVIYPPLKIDGDISNSTDDYYLVVSRLVDYKRIDLAIHTCNELRRRLRIVGDGEQYKNLKKIAGPGIEFLGFIPDQQVRTEFAHCRALLFPGEEDLGATPVEAQSFGRPVIAYGQGGVLETVTPYTGRGSESPEQCTGVFFHQQTPDAFAQAILKFEAAEHAFSPDFIKSTVNRFGEQRFKTEMYDFVEHCMAHHRNGVSSLE